MAADPTYFTTNSALALSSVPVLCTLAYQSSKVFLPKHTSRKDRYIFIWMAFDTLSHVFYEASWLYYSTFGRQVITSSGPFAALWKEYASADARWGVADPAMVCLEIVSVLCGGPLCCYILKLLINDDPARHYWIIILCTGELLATWVMFATEWLMGNENLDTSNPLYLWVYLVFLNTPWSTVPIWLMFNSYSVITRSLRETQKSQKIKGH